MRIINIDRKAGIIELQIEDINDLYVLWNFLRPGDYVEATTSRKVKFESGNVERIKMRLTIEVERVGFHEMLETLRVSGRIVEGPQKYTSEGAHHTIKLGVGMKVKILRPQGFSDTDIEILEEADILRTLNPIIIVAVERDEATVGILYGYKIKIITSVYQSVSYKDAANAESIKKAFFSKICNVIKEILRQHKSIDAIIVAGPGLTKKSFASYMKSSLGEKMLGDIPVIIDQASSGTVSAIYEVLRRGTILKVSSRMIIAQDIKDFEEFLEHLGRGDGLAVYGVDVVARVAEWGAARKILVCVELINTANEKLRERTLAMIRHAKSSSCDIRIISRTHPLHDRLENFGGIVAILRYRIGEGVGGMASTL